MTRPPRSICPSDVGHVVMPVAFCTSAGVAATTRTFGSAANCASPRRVIAVRVRVDHHERHWFVAFLGGPLRHQIEDHRRCRNHAARALFRHAGVLEQRLVLAKDQIEERLLGVDAAGLAQDVEVLVVRVHLPVGYGHTVGTAGEPWFGERARCEAGAVAFQREGPGGEQQRDHESAGLHEPHHRTAGAGSEGPPLFGSGPSPDKNVA